MTSPTSDMPEPVTLPDEASSHLIALGQVLLHPQLPSPAPGQAWRATWHGESTLGVILDVDDDDRSAELAPLTVDTDYADAYSAVLSADCTALGVETAVWAGLTTPVPFFVLDRHLGDLPGHITEAITSLWRSNLAGLAPPADTAVPTGSSDVDEADSRRAYRNQLQAELRCFQAAELIGSDERYQPSELPQKLRAAGVNPSHLVSDDLPLAQARQVAQGHAQVTEDLASRIAELLGEGDPADYVCEAPPVPPALARNLNHPARFALVRDIMIEENLDEAAAVRRIPAMVRWREMTADASDDDTFWAHALDVLQSRA